MAGADGEAQGRGPGQRAGAVATNLPDCGETSGAMVNQEQVQKPFWYGVGDGCPHRPQFFGKGEGEPFCNGVFRTETF